MAPSTRRYRNVECGTWDSADFLSLSSPQKPNAQHLWFYILTGTQTGIVPGLFRFSIAEAAERFAWSTRGTRTCFDEILARGMAEFDDSTRLLWLPKALAGRNVPASTNVVRSWRKAWVELPECDLKAKAQASMEGFLEAIGEGFAKAFREVIGDGSAHPSPIQEQDSGTVSDLNQNLSPALSCLQGGARR